MAEATGPGPGRHGKRKPKTTPSPLRSSSPVLPHLDLLVPHHLDTALVERPLRDNLVTTNPRKDLGPDDPVHGAQEENADTDDGEDIVWVPVGRPAARGWDEGHDDEERVGQEPQDRDGQVGVPGGSPVLCLAPLQIDEAGPDEAVDPGTGVGVAIAGEADVS